MEIKEAVAALTALAQESRLEVFRLLIPTGTDGLPAGEISKALSIPGATLTFHLKELTHAGLIESRREGRSIIYSLRVKGMADLLAFLTKDCCQGRPEFCGGASAECCPPSKKKKAGRVVK